LKAEGKQAVRADLKLAGPLHPDIVFQDHETMTWGAVSEALTYSVYRGVLSDLQDGDADGLPDSGFGLCMNSADPNTADTSFWDSELPAEANTGFFYLVTFVAADGEWSIGNTSAGLGRLPEAICP
jgi:hypothetical protein